MRVRHPRHHALKSNILSMAAAAALLSPSSLLHGRIDGGSTMSVPARADSSNLVMTALWEAWQCAAYGGVSSRASSASQLRPQKKGWQRMLSVPRRVPEWDRAAVRLMHAAE